jgi:hypothetical protein
MTSRISLLLPLSVAALAVTFALAGCSAGGGRSTASDPKATASAEASAIAGASGAASSTSADPTQACTLVSLAQAQSAIRSTPAITQQQAGTFVDGEPECGYASDDGQTIVVNVTIWPDASKFDLQHAVVSNNVLAPVSGVGDKAAAGPIELDAIVGSRGVSVESFGTTDVTGDQLVAMAKLVVAGLR